MKKIISVILAVLLCLAVQVPVFADNGDEVSSLILLAKSRFNIDDGKFVFADYSKDSYSGNEVYYLRWESRESDDYSYQPSINVRIDSSGNVEYYRLNKSTDNEPSIPSYSEEEALARANDLIKIIAPERARNVAEGDVGNSLYTVTFQRIENGIPVSGDYITIVLDPQTLELIHYRALWTNSDFPVPENIIPENDAADAYKSKIGYEPLYNIVTEKNAVKEVYFSYAPKAKSAYIDAVSGGAKLHSGGIYYSGSGGDMKNDAAVTEEADESFLSAEEKAVVAEAEKMLTKDEAEKLAREIKELGIPADAKISGYSVAKTRYGQYAVSISFSKNDNENYYYAHAEFNANTKELLRFWQSSDEEENNEYGTEKAKKKAEDFLNKYYSEKFSQTKPEFTLDEDDSYEFSYDRYHNGVRVRENGLSVSIDRNSGMISNLRCTWTETDFPKISGSVGLEKIYDKLMSDNNFRLVYLITEIYNADGKDSIKVNLAYAPQATPIYNGENGMEIDSFGKPIRKSFSGYNDISGNFCENSALNLAKIGIYFDEESLQPEKASTTEEFLRHLLHAVQNINLDEDDEVLRYALAEDIISKDDINTPLTRMNAIRYTVNALGFKKAAEISGIYNCVFGDVAENMQGYGAIAGGLGIVSTAVSNLRPNDLLTRGECVTMIYNSLKK